MTYRDFTSEFMGFLPVMDVDTVHGDPRRGEDRDGAPSALWHIDDTGTAHELRFDIELDRIAGLRVAPAVAVNCSAGGLCMVSQAAARVDEAVRITALDVASGELLFRETYVVCGRRRADDMAAIIRGPNPATGDNGPVRVLASSNGGAPGREPWAGREAHRYALRLDHDGNSQVFKSYLDSLLLEYLQDQPDLDLDRLLKKIAGRGSKSRRRDEKN